MMTNDGVEVLLRLGVADQHAFIAVRLACPRRAQSDGTQVEGEIGGYALGSRVASDPLRAATGMSALCRKGRRDDRPIESAAVRYGAR